MRCVGVCRRNLISWIVVKRRTQKHSRNFISLTPRTVVAQITSRLKSRFFFLLHMYVNCKPIHNHLWGLFFFRGVLSRFPPQGRSRDCGSGGKGQSHLLNDSCLQLHYQKKNAPEKPLKGYRKTRVSRT